MLKKNFFIPIWKDMRRVNNDRVFIFSRTVPLKESVKYIGALQHCS